MKYLLFFVLLCYTSISIAQIHVGSNEIASLNRAGSLSDDYIAALKNTTTLFVLQEKDYDNVKQWDNAIKDVWTITPYKIIRLEEMGDYANQHGYSFFSFGCFVIESRSKAISNYTVHMSYDLWMPRYKKNGDMKGADYYARLFLFPDHTTDAFAISAMNHKDFSGAMTEKLYKTASLYNWTPGMMKGFLSTANERLTAQDSRGPFTDETDGQALSRLQNDTLYVPDYVNNKYNPYVGKETQADKEGNDDDALKNAYPYPIKFVSTVELNRLIADKNRDIFYLVYVKSSSDKYIDVFESGNNKLLYSRYVSASYNFKNKDLAKLARVMK
jgi:hypothetical protein